MEEKNVKATASFYTLGCKLNFSETSTIATLLQQRGIHKALPSETPDICVVNTCSVTETADKKARALIRRIHARYPDAAIIATGCYAQLQPQSLAGLPGVVIVLGSNEKLDMANWIDRWLDNRQKSVAVTPHLDMLQFKPSCQRGDRTRFFLKVQDGCDYYCSYCTIPFARGRSRSGEITDLVKLAKNAASQGGKEIVLTGVNTGDFGRGTPYGFFDLIKALDKVEGIERFRISSIEPNLLSDEIIEWIAKDSRAFMPHFHIPLQSGSDYVLRLMRRRYDTALFRKKILRIRNLMPDAFIGVDIIAGARGETTEQWETSFNFASSLPITRYHVFPYSERPGTNALDLDNPVSQQEKHRRVALLTKLSERKLRNFSESNLLTTRPVLWESIDSKGFIHGLTDNYLRVRTPFSEKIHINSISTAKLSDFASDRPDLIDVIPQ